MLCDAGIWYTFGREVIPEMVIRSTPHNDLFHDDGKAEDVSLLSSLNNICGA